MEITLSPQEEKFVAEQIESGAFRTAEDLVKHALETFMVQETFINANAAKLRAEIQIGIEQIERGETVDAEEVFERVIKKNLRRPRLPKTN